MVFKPCTLLDELLGFFHFSAIRLFPFLQLLGFFLFCSYWAFFPIFCSYWAFSIFAGDVLGLMKKKQERNIAYSMLVKTKCFKNWQLCGWLNECKLSFISLVFLYNTMTIFDTTVEKDHWKHCGKRKMLVTSIVSSFHTVFYPIQQQLHHLSHIDNVVCKCFQYGQG